MISLRRIGGLLVVFALLLGPSALAGEFRIRPHLQNVSQEGATVIWETTASSIGSLQYGLKGASLDLRADEPEAVKIHRLRMTGLKAGTEYTYRVDVQGDLHEASFVTAPGDEREIVFIVLGDSRRWGARWSETGMDEHIKQWDAEFFMNMGDLVVNGHEYEQWPEHFGRFEDAAASKWFVTVRGNHEGSQKRDTENDWFGKYHEFPNGEPYSFFDWGNTHFVLISYESTGSNRAWTQSGQWLDTHLAGVDKPYTVVAQHFPVYCTGYDSTDLNRKETGERPEPYRKILDKHRVTLNLAGHTHIYERHYPLREDRRDDRNGTVYVVNGGDINANYPDWWSAVTDNKATMDQPTYTVFLCKQDRVVSRTFAWSKADKNIAEIDHFVIWRDEAIPRAILDGLGQKSGSALSAAIEELGAMLYAPAAKPLLEYLGHQDPTLRLAAAKAISLIANEAIAAEVLERLPAEDGSIAAYLARALEVALPKNLVKKVSKLATSPNTPQRVRFHLIGALQLHAPAEVAADAALDILDSKPAAPAEVRRRAVYALGQTATKSDAKALTAQVADESDPYVTMTLAWTLNALTRNRVSLRSSGAFAKSAPGERREFIEKWLSK